MTIPAWLLRQLEASGHLDTDGTTRAVRSRRCGGCPATVLVGLDADRCAVAVVTDPGPVDVVGEALAVLAGRSTYDLVATAARVELDHRCAARIRGRRRYPVVAAHRCGLPPLPSDPDPPTLRRSQPATDTPPF